VVLGVPPNLLDLAAMAGVEAVALGPDSQLLLESDLVQVQAKSANPVTRVRALSELGTYGWRELARDLDAVASDAGAIVTSFLGQEVARALADKHNLAQVAVHFCPIRPARSVSLVPLPPIGAAVANRLVWAGLDQSWRAMTARGEDRMRRDLGLAPSRGRLSARMTAAAGLEVQAIDPQLFPDLPAEWGSRRPLVGFVDFDDQTLTAISATDATLEAWLDAGPPPIYWGFGSMPVGDPQATLDLVAAVSAQLGIRSLVCAGWSEFDTHDDELVRVVQSISHRVVLARCAVAVHHGGAGTTAAALRAGTPSLVAWFGADQQFWGRRLEALGVGLVTAFADLDVDRVTAALRVLMAPGIQAQASEVKHKLIDPAAATAALADLVERASARNRRTLGAGSAAVARAVDSAQAVARASATQAVVTPVETVSTPVLRALSAPAPLPVALSPTRPIETAVEMDALTCRFGSSTVVDSVNIGIRQGTVFALLGPNGAGKTTVVRMLATLQPPTAGTARVFGYDICRDSHQVRSLIALTGQYAAVDEDLTGRENLVVFSRLLGLSRAGARHRAEELLESFSLTEAGDRSLRSFSGGMRRRLDLAVSLIARPPLIFLDEPTTGLDPRTRVQLWDTIRALVADGATVLLTTQYLEEADQLADRIAVINHGKVVANGTADELKASVGTANLRINLAEAEDLPVCAQITERLLGRDVARVDERTVSVAVTDTSVVADVLIALRSANVTVAEVMVQKPSLDEVFFDLTSQPVIADSEAAA
jgi:daunorubicin resistance ABC transporter ATP-binding subunit